MLTAVILLFLFIWLYRKRSTYNPYEVKYSHSSYYDCTFTGPENVRRESVPPSARWRDTAACCPLPVFPGRRDRRARTCF